MTAAPHRFLVPVDASAGVTAAIELAASLARRLDGTLTLLAIAPLTPPVVPAAADPLAGIAPAGAGEQELLDQLAREQLDELVARVGDDIDTRGVLSWGPAGDATVDQAGTGEFDVVVIAWPHRGAIGHLLHDHAARYVLDHSPIPVLVVPPPDAD